MAADTLHPEPGRVHSEEDPQVEDVNMSAELWDVCSNIEDLGVEMTDSGTMLFHYSEATVSKAAVNVNFSQHSLYWLPRVLGLSSN